MSFGCRVQGNHVSAPHMGWLPASGCGPAQIGKKLLIFLRKNEGHSNGHSHRGSYSHSHSNPHSHSHSHSHGHGHGHGHGGAPPGSSSSSRRRTCPPAAPRRTGPLLAAYTPLAEHFPVGSPPQPPIYGHVLRALFGAVVMKQVSAGGYPPNPGITSRRSET